MPDDDFSSPAEPSAAGGRPLNLRQIEVFRAIMMAGSISAAGRMLHVSQPAVSRVLALTESRLGYPLFERVKSRLVPTPEARRLYGEVEQVYGGIQRVNDLAGALGRQGAGMLRVVSSASFGQQLVPRALARLSQGGQVRVDYRTVTYDEMPGYFLSGKADVGLSMSPPDHANLASQRLGEQPLVCLLPPDHPLAAQPAVRAADLADTAWIGYPPDTPLGRALRPFLDGAPGGRPAALEVHSPVTACACVQQGLGPGLVDRWCVTPELARSLAVRPLEPAVQVEIWATHSSLAPLPLLARRLLAEVGEVLAAGG